MTLGSPLPVSRATRTLRRREALASGCGATQVFRPQTCARRLSARGVLYGRDMVADAKTLELPQLLGMIADAKTLELLQLLGKAWIVTLTSSREDDAWQLRIDSPPHWDESFSYTYRGMLASVVVRAYEGEPDDGSAEVPA